MREIKFRAWHKHSRIMADVINIKFQYKEITLDVPTDKINPDWVCWWHATNVNFDEIELMQYTGLKDKNGKEIYEGDICRWRDLETFNGEIIEDIFVVIWNNEKLAWYTQNLDSNFGYDLYEYTDDRDLEVIGNIYENADLLGVEEGSCV